MYRMTGLVVATLFMAISAPAQTTQASQPSATTVPDARDLELREMRARIERRETLVERLQKERESTATGVATASASNPTQPTTASAQPPESSRVSAAELHAGVDHHAGADERIGGQVETHGAIEQRYPQLHFRGFGDIDFSATDDPGSKSGFNLGQFILHVASPLSQKVSVFGEISFSASTGFYNVDIERYLIRYDYNDHFKLSFGRYHTPINYWNTAFHHGLWLQTTISRPEMIRFGGRFLPVPFLGMLAEGNIPSGPLGLGYEVGLGNGRAGTISRAGDAGDVNSNRAWVANLFARPAALNGLQIGGSLFGDLITSPGVSPGNPNFRELISTAHVVWTKESPEFLAEFAHVRHRNVLTENVFNSNSAYVQIAYRLPGEGHKWKPYYRFEWSNISPSDPLFVGDNSVAVRPLTGSTFGVRYDITNLAAFKGEYRHITRKPNDPHVNGLFFQTSFTF